MLVTIIGAALVLVAGCITFVVAAGGDETAADSGGGSSGNSVVEPGAAASASPTSAQALAEQVVAALNAKDFSSLGELACGDADVSSELFDPANLQGVDYRAEIGKVHDYGDAAALSIGFTVMGQSEIAPPLMLKKDGSTWCIGS